MGVALANGTLRDSAAAIGFEGPNGAFPALSRLPGPDPQSESRALGVLLPYPFGCDAVPAMSRAPPTPHFC
jgi:hypothetical protein